MKAFVAAFIVVLGLVLSGLGATAQAAPEDAWANDEPDASDTRTAADAASEGVLRVHFLNIGRNDGILLECDGEAAFVDAGDVAYAKKAIKYMRARGVQSLKYYVATHGHRDHIGGGPAIMAALPTDTVLYAHRQVKLALSQYADTASEKRAVKNASYFIMQPGDMVTLGGAQIECLGPETIVRTSIADQEENKNSLVLKLVYGDTSFLLTGDTTDGVLETIEAHTPGALRTNVFKNPHHNGDIGADVVRAAAPEYIVFSTSAERMPDKAFVAGLRAMGICMLATNALDSGTAVFETDGTQLTLKTARDYQTLAVKPEQVTVAVGEKAQLKYTAKPARRLSRPGLTSADETIAKVNQNGVLMGVAPGTTVITVTTYNGLTAQVAVTVTG